MPPPNRVLYDVLCVALSAAEICGRAAAIQAEQALGTRAVKRDWWGNEIGRPVAEWQGGAKDQPSRDRQDMDATPSGVTETPRPRAQTATASSGLSLPSQTFHPPTRVAQPLVSSPTTFPAAHAPAPPEPSSKLVDATTLQSGQLSTTSTRFPSSLPPLPRLSADDEESVSESDVNPRAPGPEPLISDTSRYESVQGSFIYPGKVVSLWMYVRASQTETSLPHSLIE